MRLRVRVRVRVKRRHIVCHGFAANTIGRSFEGRERERERDVSYYIVYSPDEVSKLRLAIHSFPEEGRAASVTKR